MLFFCVILIVFYTIYNIKKYKEYIVPPLKQISPIITKTIIITTTATKIGTKTTTTITISAIAKRIRHEPM